MSFLEDGPRFEPSFCKKNKPRLSAESRPVIFESGSCYCDNHFIPDCRYKEHGLIYMPVRLVDKLASIAYTAGTSAIEIMTGEKCARRPQCEYCGRRVCHHLVASPGRGSWTVKN